MSTTWNATPVFSPRSITELHDAIYLVGGSPAVWTDGTELPLNTTLRKVHLTEVLDAIQRLWNDRDLGLIPNWTDQAESWFPSGEPHNGFETVVQPLGELGRPARGALVGS